MYAVLSRPEDDELEFVGLAETPSEILELVKSIFEATEFSLLDDDNVVELIVTTDGTTFTAFELPEGESPDFDTQIADLGEFDDRILKEQFFIEVIQIEPGVLIGYGEDEFDYDSTRFTSGYIVID